MIEAACGNRKSVVADYLLYGWRVRSELPLPNGLTWNGLDLPVDVDIRLGKVPDKLAAPVLSTPFLQIAENGDCRLEVAAAGRYLVRQGREVIVQPAKDATPAEIWVFLLGSVIGMLCHQRGFFPLHASCVRIGNGAVAFCGASGSGKSTIAASLVKRGHPLLCDDITIVDPFAAGGPSVRPGIPRMRLWRDSLEALDVSLDQLQRDRIELEKYAVPSSEMGDFLTEAVPLRGVFLLRAAASPEMEGTAAMPTMETVIQLTEQVYRRRQAVAMGRKAALFQAAARIAAMVPVRSLDRQLDLGQLDRTAAMVEGLTGS